MTYRLTRPWLLLDWIYSLTTISTSEALQKRRLHSFTKKMIEQRRTVNNVTKPTRTCFLDHLIQISSSNPSFTENDIVEEACTLMLAGQDSVGAAVAFCLFLLAQNEDCQRKCHAEIDDLFRNVETNHKILLDDITKLRYVEQCVKETLRLYPSVPMIARRIREPVRLANHQLPAGSNILIFPYATQRMEQIFKNAQHFDPDRFAPEASQTCHPYSYIPFSAGYRNCIGQKFATIEMLTVLAFVLHNFELYPVPGKESINPVFRVTVRASGGLWIRIKRRR